VNPIHLPTRAIVLVKLAILAIATVLSLLGKLPAGDLATLVGIVLGGLGLTAAAQALGAAIPAPAPASSATLATLEGILPSLLQLVNAPGASAPAPAVAGFTPSPAAGTPPKALAKRIGFALAPLALLVLAGCTAAGALAVIPPAANLGVCAVDAAINGDSLAQIGQLCGSDVPSVLTAIFAAEASSSTPPATAAALKKSNAHAEGLRAVAAYSATLPPAPAPASSK